jgi:tetratricopeptide (TPR) repeat protein
MSLRGAARTTTLVLLLLLANSSPATVQAQPNTAVARFEQEFFDALGQFIKSLSGFLSDSRAIRSKIEALDRALIRWDDAIGTFEATLGSSRDADAHLALGTIYWHRHRLEDSLRELGLAARQAPQRVDVYLSMARVYDLANKPAEAADALLKASTLEPDTPATLYELARHQTRSGQTDAAERALLAFRQSVARRLQSRPADPSAPFPSVALLPLPGSAPIFPPTIYTPGFALIAEGAYGEGIVRLREAAALDGRGGASAEAAELLSRGHAALQSGNLSAAVQHFGESVKLAPNHAEAHRNLAVTLWIDGKQTESLAQLKAALRADPDDERAWSALADELATIGQYDQAEEVLKQAIQRIPRSGQARYSLGRIDQALGRYSEAAREIEEAARSNPLVGQDPLYEMLGNVYVTLADFDRAARAFARRVELAPNNADAHRRLGTALLRDDRDDDALAEFMAALLIEPRSAEAHAAVAQIHLRAGRYAEAADASTRALEVDSALKEARYALGTALMRLGRIEEGTMHIEEFRRLQAEAATGERRTYQLERLKRDAAVSIARSEYDKAAIALREALSYESAASTYLALGFALMATSHFAEAIVNLEKAAQLESGPEVHRYLAEAYGAVGRLDDSRSEAAIYRQVVERQKNERLRKLTGEP